MPGLPRKYLSVRPGVYHCQGGNPGLARAQLILELPNALYQIPHHLVQHQDHLLRELVDDLLRRHPRADEE